MVDGGAWVILEGPDGAGKSTAAAALASALADSGPTVLQHLTSKSAWEDYFGPAASWRLEGLSVVQDRCILSDLVYAPVLSGVTSRHGELRVRRQLRRLVPRAVVLHVCADEEVLAARLEERGDDLIDESMLHAIVKGYWREVTQWRALGAVVLDFDTSDGNYPSALDLLLAVSLGVSKLPESASVE